MLSSVIHMGYEGGDIVENIHNPVLLSIHVHTCLHALTLKRYSCYSLI